MRVFWTEPTRVVTFPHRDVKASAFYRCLIHTAAHLGPMGPGPATMDSLAGPLHRSGLQVGVLVCPSCLLLKIGHKEEWEVPETVWPAGGDVECEGHSAPSGNTSISGSSRTVWVASRDSMYNHSGLYPRVVSQAHLSLDSIRWELLARDGLDDQSDFKGINKGSTFLICILGN